MKRMNDNQTAHLHKLRIVYERRLEILEIQAANFGISTPPHVVIEIEDLQSKLSSITENLSLDEKAFYNTRASYQRNFTEKIVALFLAADPSNAARLRLGQEFRDIREIIQLSKQRDKFLLEFRESIRVKDMTQAFFDVRPNIVHFCGHATAAGICLEGIDTKIQLVETDALANLFRLFSEQINCVILNACHSIVQAETIAQYIPHVIGMKQQLSDQAAIAFSVGFYRALGCGYGIEHAYKFGCSEIQLQGVSEYLTPILVSGQISPQIMPNNPDMPEQI